MVDRDIERLFARYREAARRARLDAPPSSTGRFARSGIRTTPSRRSEDLTPARRS